MVEGKNSIHIGPTSTAEWHDLIKEITYTKKVTLSEEIESYLIFLLMRFTSQIEFIDKIIAEEYLKSLTETRYGNFRNQKLRDVGDTCLIFSGLFPEIIERRLVNLSYYIRIGRNAYLEISNNPDLFGSLAENFIKLMDILNNLRSEETQFKSQVEAINIFKNFQDDSLAKTVFGESLDNKIILHSPKSKQ